jgi:predicted hydrolase (HD superfamily)
MSKTLFAVDELTGLIIAVALLRPNQISDLKVKSVRKRFKDKSFARGLNRDDIVKGAEEVGVTVDDLITVSINAMRDIKDDLNLR